jgi:hypothetical protein
VHLGNVFVDQGLQAVSLSVDLEFSLSTFQTSCRQQYEFDKSKNTVLFDNLWCRGGFLDLFGNDFRSVKQVDFAVC